jgi:mannose-1-phosphate guanylyltransferase
MADKIQPIALIMAGGSGTRFWPASTKRKPKQYLSLWSEDSLIQMTAKRIESLVPPSRLFICSTESQRPWLEKQLPEVAHPGWLILEPTGRNTAPCLMLSALTLRKAGFTDETPMVVLPADHHISNERAFQNLLREAFDLAVRTSGLITFGITPTSAHTGYGYI